MGADDAHPVPAADRAGSAVAWTVAIDACVSVIRNAATAVLLLVCLCAASPALAAADALVEAVQMPAWLERAGVAVPLSPGMALRTGDSVRTGPDARLLLRTAEGSAVKLGERAILRLDHLRMRADGSVFEGALNVATGAFRFTTSALARFRGRRVVDVRIATLTAGIRGTDLWGKAEPDRDFIVLIEGKIEVRRANDAPTVMDQALSLYIAPRDQPAQYLPAVDPKQLEVWAAETEIESGRGGARQGGRWKVVLATVPTQAEALAAYDAVRAAGYAAEIWPHERDGQRAYDVRVSHLSSQADAQALAQALRGKPGVTEPRVTQ